jgi:hypothetical protein
VKTVVGPEDQETVFPEARRLEIKGRGQKGLPVDRTIFGQSLPYTKVQETKCRLWRQASLGKHRCFYGLRFADVELASALVEYGGGNLKFTSTFVPPSVERILYLLSYCSLVRLRLHSLQI